MAVFFFNESFVGSFDVRVKYICTKLDVATQGSDINLDPYDRVNFLCPLNHCFMAHEIQSFGRLAGN